MVHSSNANIRAPNNITNTFAFNAGLSYQLAAENFPDYNPMSGDEPDYVNQGAFPFYVFSGFAFK
ncbi:MAG: hypothetical protein ACI825_001588 [Planctomycetota bacterium]|jgi:hypothetical protein|uniref:hypothetical protein n=1 Tax=Patiriisocius sp. Uisw_047 TaxID=3230969 RepID=UPI0039EACBB0